MINHFCCNFYFYQRFKDEFVEIHRRGGGGGGGGVLDPIRPRIAVEMNGERVGRGVKHVGYLVVLALPANTTELDVEAERHRLHSALD